MTPTQSQILSVIVRILDDNRETLLMDLQGDHCGCNGGQPKLVFKSPAAYRIGKLLEENRSWIQKSELH